jgi:hypothetical protein
LIRVAEASSRFPKKGVTNIEAVETRVLNSLNQTTAYATSLKVIFAYIATVGFASFTACMHAWLALFSSADANDGTLLRSGN